MKSLSITILMILFHVSLNAQYVQINWAKSIIGTQDDVVNAIAVDNVGNVYTTGYFQGIVDLDPGPGTYDVTSTGVASMFISKLDASGNFLWGYGFNNASNGLAITVDASLNVFLTGVFSNVMDLDPGPGIYNLTSAGYEDVFILKLNMSGNFVWAKRVGSTGYDSGVGIVIDSFSNIVITGTYGNSVDFDPGPGTYTLSSMFISGFVLKLNVFGNFVWAKSYDALSVNAWCAPKGLITDVSGNVYTTGSFVNGTIDFDPGIAVYSFTTNNIWNTFVSKLDSAGNFVWAKQFTGTNACDASSIKLDASNNVYTTGNFVDIVDFDPGPGVYTVSATQAANSYVSKLDSNGIFLAAISVSAGANNRAMSITTDLNANVYITGRYFGLTDFDPGPGTYYLGSIDQDIFVAAYTSSLNFIWAKTLYSTGTNDIGNSITTFSGNIYSAGTFAYPLNDFDSGPGTYTLPALANLEAYVHKMSPCIGPTVSAITGPTFVCQGSVHFYSVSPLPFNSTGSWSFPVGWSGTSLTNTINLICNSTGILTVNAVDGVCGPGLSQTLNIIVNPIPTITVNNGALCIGDSFTITPSGANTYTFQGGNAIVSPTSNTTYTVAGTSSAGCISSTAAICNITVNALPNVTANTNNTILCLGESATLTANGANTFTWNPGGVGNSIIVTPTINTNYTVSGTDLNGCTSMTVITQSVYPCTGLNSIYSSFPEIKIYPNPTSGNITLTKDGTIPEEIEIYNCFGTLIYTICISESEIEIDLGSRPSGIYFIRMRAFTKKIVKQ